MRQQSVHYSEQMQTVADVLAAPALRNGRPVVLAGEDSLQRPVRWVHVSELPDIDRLLDGGEVVLTMGGPLRSAPVAARFLDQLISAGVAALVVELGDDLPEVPAVAIERARVAGLPLVALRRKVRFIEITQHVHRQLVSDQLARLELSAEVHTTFTRLGLGRAGSDLIVSAAARLIDGPVVLESPRRHVVAVSGGDAERVVADWDRRSRAAVTRATTGVAGPESWLTTPVGHQGRVWARLVAPECSDVERGVVVLERASQALEMQRMIDNDDVAAGARLHGQLLAALVDGRFATEAEALNRAQSVGLRRDAEYTGLVFAAADDDVDVDQVRTLVRQLGLRAITSSLRTTGVSVLVAHDGDHGWLDDLDGVLSREHPQWVVGVGRSTASVLEVGAQLRSARRVADIAVTLTPGGSALYRPQDLRLRGLLDSLVGDFRLAQFVENELGALLAHDVRGGTSLLDLLRTYLRCNGNVSDVARVAHRNRSSLYRQIHRLERLLGCSLDDADSRTSLTVAVMAHDLAGRGDASPARATNGS
jgi:purine catabolism regulator